MQLGKTLKKDFPIFNKHKDLVYLDNASTTHMPQAALDAMTAYNTSYKSNIHRGAYLLSAEATKAYEAARLKVALFIEAEPKEIIFTSGTTDSINRIAQMISVNISSRDSIVITELEHHANLIPWQELSKKIGATLKRIVINNEHKIDESSLDVIDSTTKIVAFAHTSNALGIKLPIQTIVSRAKKVGAYTIMDAAQAIQHEKIDVKKLDIDFLVFSGHKLYGPTGIGILYGKKELLNQLDPTIYGGGMIKEVTFEEASWSDIPQKFEPGTPPIAQAIGLGASIDYVSKIGFEFIHDYENNLSTYAYEQLNKLNGITILSPKGSTIISFTVDAMHPHDLASMLDGDFVAVRAGHHCAMPLMKKLGITGTIRISLGIYNTKTDIDACMASIQKAILFFNN